MSAKRQHTDTGKRGSRMLAIIAVAIFITIAIIIYGRTHTPPQQQILQNETARFIPRASTPVQTLEQLVALADDRQDDARIQYQAGSALMNDGQFREARLYLERAVNLDPANTLAYNALGVALAQAGMHREALVAYQAAIDLDPDYVEAHYNLGTAALNLGDTHTAIEQFKAAIALDSTFIRAYNNLGGVYAQQGNLEEAVAQYNAILAIDPAFAGAHRNLASIHDHLGNDEQAARHREMMND